MKKAQMRSLYPFYKNYKTSHIKHIGHFVQMNNVHT
jgi:hypothetical protein